MLTGLAQTIDQFRTTLRSQNLLWIEFRVNEKVLAMSRGNRDERLCLHLFDVETREKLGSYAVDDIDDADYMPAYREPRLDTDFGITLEQAAKMAMERR